MWNSLIYVQLFRLKIQKSISNTYVWINAESKIYNRSSITKLIDPKYKPF